MKRSFLIPLMSITLFACNQGKPTASLPESTATSEMESNSNTFGASFTEDNVIGVTELQTLAQGKDSVEAVVSAEIMESCQAKGCWMDVKLKDNSTMKVTFRDYGFFLPTENLKGRTVVFTGTAKRETISVDDQRHYAKDAGKSNYEIAAITYPKEELRFVADGVILK
ncbi:DUF4920 domain-containing protein [Pontibacter sp. E15-1]|uniref:DUF4920 domain-containing protein n=1 Tax=Pontibacter sp. E15-1 TaxID=2919918 RepID=UPI001F4F38F3|nr:DUF4920 domain-containing protein [Pontibacter sp. E15-1]MCJ8165544.1 DUF4920 domain-containing protein [Pontibacter sp. E15-1]